MLRSLALASVFSLFASSPLSAQVLNFCAGDGTLPVACPCQNFGITGHGCANSANAAGAYLSGTGGVVPDTIVFTAVGGRPNVLSVLYQSDSRNGGFVFGDGVSCQAGNVRRLFWRLASGNTVSFPGPGEPSISQRSAALGDTIPHPGFRYYNVQYRDKSTTFCPDPQGATWNVTNTVMVSW